MAVGQSQSQYLDEYPKLSPQLPGYSLAWMRQFREDAFNAFSKTGFPTNREEEWRYTNVSAIEKKRFSSFLSDADQTLPDPAWLDQHLLTDVWTVVILNGRLCPALSRLQGLPDDVTVMGLAEAFQQHPEQLEKYFAQAVNALEHGFVAFNGAWFSDGLFVHVPEKASLSKPIQLLHIVTRDAFMATTRNLFIVDPMADVKIIETFTSLDHAYVSTAVNEVFVAENASLTLYTLQMASEKAYHFGGTYVKQSCNSRFSHQNFAFGGLIARNDIHTDLDKASECTLNGLFLGHKRQHIDNHTRINHLKPYAISRQLYKGVLDQGARGVFQGRVLVAEDAQKSDSAMNNRNLLLSDDAEIDSKPQLEIYADDVKCAHGVTIGQLDEQSVFYLQSRCLDQISVRNLLTFAFANEMVKKIDLGILHDKVLEQLLKRFPQQGVEMEWL